MYYLIWRWKTWLATNFLIRSHGELSHVMYCTHSSYQSWPPSSIPTTIVCTDISSWYTTAKHFTLPVTVGQKTEIKISELRFSRLWGWWCSFGFWRHVHSSVDSKVSEKHTVSISPEDGYSMFLRNVGIYRRVYMAPKPRRTTSSEIEMLMQLKCRYKLLLHQYISQRKSDQCYLYCLETRKKRRLLSDNFLINST
jgi:hypothetical protein